MMPPAFTTARRNTSELASSRRSAVPAADDKWQIEKRRMSRPSRASKIQACAARSMITG